MANPGQDANVFKSGERDRQDFAVVASTPRSGTTFIRGVLAECGIKTGHENVFMSSGGINKPPDWLTVEVSGFAGLHPFVNEGSVAHQVRNPLKAISSLATLGLLRTHDPVQIAEWYCMVIANNEAASDFTYRIEDMNPSELGLLTKTLGFNIPQIQLEKALKQGDQYRNSRDRTDLTLSDLGEHGRMVDVWMREFGYGG